MTIYTVTFNPALDYVIQVAPALQLGTINRTSKEQLKAGGKGINVSIVLQALGIPSVALGFVAGFTGRQIEEEVRSLGIDTGFIALEEGLSRINVKVKDAGSSDAKKEEGESGSSRGGAETEINGQGPSIPPAALEALLRQLEDTLEAGDVLVLAGSIPNTLPDDVYERIMARVNKIKLPVKISGDANETRNNNVLLKEPGVLVVVDATKKLLLNVLKYKPFLIKPNNVELAEIFAPEQVDKKLSEEQLIGYARKLQEMGARHVLVSMAGDGSLFVPAPEENEEEGGSKKTSSFPVLRMGVAKGKVESSVGAGDSMVAGFLAGLLRSSSPSHHVDEEENKGGHHHQGGENPYMEALRVGTAAGGATAFTAGLATREKIMEVLPTLPPPSIVVEERSKI